MKKPDGPSRASNVPKKQSKKEKDATSARRSKQRMLIWSGLGLVVVCWIVVGVWYVSGRKRPAADALVAANEPPPGKISPLPDPASAVPPVPTPGPAPTPATTPEPPPVPFGKRLNAKEQEEKIKAALTLCSKTAFPDPNPPPDVYSVGQEDYMKRPAAEGNALFNEGSRILWTRSPNGVLDLGDIYPRAAQVMARIVPDANYYLRFTEKAKPVSFAPIRAVLGVEDSTSPGGLPDSSTAKTSVTWHFYGWCGFGVTLDGKVIALKTECSRVKVDPGTPAPPPLVTELPAKEQPLHRLRHDGLVNGTLFAAAGAELVSWEANGTIHIWDVKDGDRKKRLAVGDKGDRFPPPLQRAAPLSPTRWLLLANQELVYWESAKGQISVAGTNGGDRLLDWHVSATTGPLVLTRNQEVLGLKSKTVRSLGKRGPASGKVDPLPADLFKAPPGSDYRGEPVGAFTPDGRRVVWAANDRLSIFEVSTGKELHAFEEAGYINALAISADGNRAITGESRRGQSGIGAVGTSGETVRIWDLKAKKLLSAHSHGPSDNPYALGRSVALSPDGQRALICWRDQKGGGTLQLLDFAGTTGRVLDETMPPLPPASLTEGFNLGGGSSSPPPPARTIDSVQFSPDGKHAISYGKYGTSGGEIRVWKLNPDKSDAP